MTTWLWLVLAATPWMAMPEPRRAEAVQALRPLPMRERVLRASEAFLGTPYLLSPLGEGAGPDADPLLRWDAVDCVTMVEQSLAVALAPDAAAVLPTLNGLRYAEAPSWASRLHLMEAQWLPENVRRGYLKDVTRAWGGARTVPAKKVLSPATWRERQGAALQLPEASRPVGTFALEIIPAAHALEVLRQAPAGLLVVVVRADRPTSVTRVSHVGVLVQGKAGPMLRHASRSFRRVVDEPLARYLRRNLEVGAWTIEGLALYEPTAPEASVADR